MHTDAPLVIEFVPGSVVAREETVTRGLPIVGNGPPGTTVTFSDGQTVPLPTDQVVGIDNAPAGASVAFGGMTFEGVEGELLVFYRVADLAPEHTLSPERGRKMTLRPTTVSRVIAQGRAVWPRTVA